LRNCDVAWPMPFSPSANTSSSCDRPCSRASSILATACAPSASRVRSASYWRVTVLTSEPAP
jgi:hypothetical protein